MRYASIKYPDIANGTGVRVSLFVQGCSRHCPGCFNPETWDLKGGKLFTEADKAYIFGKLALEHVSGLSILGGEPLEQLEDIVQLLAEVKSKFPTKNIWLWTGFKREDIQDAFLLSLVDVLVDGEYIQEQKDISLAFRGSKNQRIYRLNGGDRTTMLIKTVRVTNPRNVVLQIPGYVSYQWALSENDELEVIYNEQTKEVTIRPHVLRRSDTATQGN